LLDITHHRQKAAPGPRDISIYCRSQHFRQSLIALKTPTDPRGTIFAALFASA
jgi:hypothetical protein